MKTIFFILPLFLLTVTMQHLDAKETYSNFPPAAGPTLLTPANSNTATYIRNPSFTWSGILNAASYDIEIALDASFNTKIVALNKLYITRYVPVTRLPLATLYWRVRFVDSNNTQSNWSSSFKCVIAAPTKIVNIPLNASLKQIKDSMRSALNGNVPCVLSFAPNSTYILDEGIKNSDVYAIDTSKVNNLIIEGNNATIIIRNHLKTGFLRFTNSSNITIRRLKFDWDPLPHSLLDVIKVNNNDSTTLDINVRLRRVANQSSSFYPKLDDATFQANWWGGYLLDKDSSLKGSIKKIPTNVFGIQPRSISTITGGSCDSLGVAPVYNIYYSGSLSGKYFQVGDILAIICRDNTAGVFNANGCNNVTVDSVINFSSPMAIYYSYSSNDCKVLNCKAEFRDSTRFITSNADGINAFSNPLGPWIENCFFKGLGDDAIALYNKGTFIHSKISDSSLNVFGGYMNIAKGDKFTIFDPVAGKIIDTVFTADSVKAITTTNPKTNYIKFSPSLTVQQYSNLGNVGILPNVDSPYIETLNAQLFNVSKSNNNFMVKNNTLMARGRGVAPRSFSGVIDSNLIIGCSRSGIEVSNEPYQWFNGLNSNNLRITNNIIQHSGFDNLGVNIGSIAILTNRIKSLGNGKYVDTVSENTKRNINILIDRNTISSYPKHGISLFNATNCTISNNSISSNVTNFLHQAPHYGIYIFTTTNIKILNNTFSGSLINNSNVKALNDTLTTIVP